MMKQYLFVLTFLTSSIGLFAQCPISVSLTSVPDLTIAAVTSGELIELTATPSIGAIVTQYVWVESTPDGPKILSGNGPRITVTVQNQNVTVYMQTMTLCDLDTVDITIRLHTISASEVITPNGDGYSDTWVINNIHLYPENKVFIFDRWGQRVYHKVGYDNADGWGAEYIGSDLPVSTYYYFLEIKPEDGGEEFTLRGPISVFR